MAEVEQARRRYEALLDVETLKVNLQDALDRRDQLYERISHCLELRNNMTLIKEDGLTSLKTRVNLGCDFFVNAKIPDTSSVYVNVGLGFHAEMTIDEAIAFSTAQEAQLSGAADELTDQVVELKARIKLVARALNELGTVAR